MRRHLPSPAVFLAGGSYWLSLAAYSIASYGLTAPNLVLSQWEPFWHFQQYMWQTLYNDRVFLTTVFSLLFLWIVGSFITLLITLWRSSLLQRRRSLTWYLAVVLCFAAPLLLSMNALSYDVFNYIFNAHMVLEYRGNPHLQTAQSFSFDPWVRFMHNVHTPAPYGYGWTALSLIPAAMGRLLGGSFLITWLLFRGMMLLSLLLLTAVLWWGRSILTSIWKKSAASSHNDAALTSWTLHSQLAILSIALHPLVLIEVISTMHNDLWMMAPAIASLLIVVQRPQHRRYLWIGLSALLLLASISIKLATVVLLPIWLLCTLWLLLPSLGDQIMKRVRDISDSSITRYSFVICMLIGAAIALFVPLLTARSKRFLSWYILWSLSCLPLILVPLRERWLAILRDTTVALILTLSGTALLRYTPFLKVGEYTPAVLQIQLSLTWLPAVIVTSGVLLWHLSRSFKYTSRR